MAQTRTLTRSFDGGELSQEFWGRTDDPKYRRGLAICQNMIIAPQGHAKSRPGTKFVRAAKYSDHRCRLIPFQYSDTQSFAIEMGEGYFRFHTQAATLLVGSPAAYNGATAYTVGDLVTSAGNKYYCIAATTGNAPPNVAYWYAIPSAAYEIPNPYTASDLKFIKYEQSEDVLTLTHPDYEPRELRRYGATDWRLEVPSFSIGIAAPANLTVTESISPDHAGTANTNWRYAVTAIGDPITEESERSGAVTAFNNLLEADAYNDLDWDSVSGATRYNVYKEVGGVFGFIGTSTSSELRDNNVTPDTSITPPEEYNPFSGSDNYPAAVGYFQQRRVFGGTNNNPNAFSLTKTGTENNFSFSLPLKPDDGINQRLKSRERHFIRHIVPMDDLIILTNRAEWLVRSSDASGITPTNMQAAPKSYRGCSHVRPVVVNRNVLFITEFGNRLTEIGYSTEGGGFVTGEVSLRAYHLFEGKSAYDMAYQQGDNPVVWIADGEGDLIGLTYLPEEQVGAFHRHSSGDGNFETVCAVTEDGEDFLYVCVQRIVDGSAVRYIERLESRRFDDVSDCFNVDCGLTYEGAATNTITGLDHLEGETVNILANGTVRTQQVVTSGSVTISGAAATKAHIGLPIDYQLSPTPLYFETNGGGMGRPKNINKVWFRVYESGPFKMGPSLDDMEDTDFDDSDLFSGEAYIDLPSSWQETDGRVYLRTTRPLPLTVQAMSMEVTVGG